MKNFLLMLAMVMITTWLFGTGEAVAAGLSRSEVVGKERANLISSAIKKKHKSTIEADKIAKSPIGINLKEAIGRLRKTKGATENCDEAREMISSDAFGNITQCSGFMDDVAERGSCDLVQALVDYLSENLLGDAQECQMYTWGSNGVGACGCGCSCCIVLMND